VGSGNGEGYTVNVPLAPGKGDEDYLFIFQQLLSPITAAYKPEFILVSAGFDIFEGDPLGGMDISAKGFGTLAAELLTLARTTSHQRLLFTLEGGYNLFGLEDGVKNVLFVLGGKEKVSAHKAQISASTERELSPIFKVQKKYWPVNV
jgi:acetoin utilization deacetylase AcuC-like enzyme